MAQVPSKRSQQGESSLALYIVHGVVCEDGDPSHLTHHVNDAGSLRHLAHYAKAWVLLSPQTKLVTQTFPHLVSLLISGRLSDRSASREPSSTAVRMSRCMPREVLRTETCAEAPSDVSLCTLRPHRHSCVGSQVRVERKGLQSKECVMMVLPWLPSQTVIRLFLAFQALGEHAHMGASPGVLGGDATKKSLCDALVCHLNVRCGVPSPHRCREGLHEMQWGWPFPLSDPSRRQLGVRCSLDVA